MGFRPGSLSIRSCRRSIFAKSKPTSIQLCDARSTLRHPVIRIVRQMSGAGNSKISAMPAHLFASGSFYHRATDSRSHLLMSAEPFLVSDRVRSNSARVFQNTQGVRLSNLDLSDEGCEASVRRSAVLPNLLPLANQHVDDSWGITEADGLPCAVTLSEKMLASQTLKALGHRHFRVHCVIFALSLSISAEFFDR